jgi:hypothetical protein
MPGFRLVREFAGVVVFLVTRRTIVRVRIADEAIAIGIALALGIEREPVEQGLAGEAAGPMRRTLRVGGQRVIPLLETGELVVR